MSGSTMLVQNLSVAAIQMGNGYLPTDIEAPDELLKDVLIRPDVFDGLQTPEDRAPTYP